MPIGMKTPDKGRDGKKGNTMNKLVKESEYFVAWFVFWLCGTVGGFIVGGIAGGIVGAILGAAGAET